MRSAVKKPAQAGHAYVIRWNGAGLIDARLMRRSLMKLLQQEYSRVQEHDA